MAKLGEIFLNIDTQISKTDSSFTGWNDAQADVCKTTLNEYKKSAASLKIKARDFVEAGKEMRVIQADIERFYGEADSLCR